MLSFFKKNKKFTLKNDVNNNLDFVPSKYTALQVSRHIINYCWDHNLFMSNLKLQYILYFAQAYFLLKYKKECFSDKIVAYDFGPVVFNVYDEYKMHGALNIPKINQYIYFDKENIWNSSVIPYYDNDISERDKKDIDELIKEFAPYTVTDLRNLVYNQKPWKAVNSRRGTCREYGIDVSREQDEKYFEITLKSIYNYFINRSID